MKQAARLHDGTSHGGGVDIASGDVEVNGAGAARLGDHHACPLTAPSAHKGGRVRFGAGAALTVLVNNRPAAARDAALGCLESATTPANVIIEGSSTVFYSVTNTLAGLPVVEDSDGDLHIGKNILIKGGSEYQALLLADLAEMASTEIGKSCLLERETSKYPLTIIPWDKKSRNAEARQHNGTTASNGIGCPSTVAYSPQMWPPSPGAQPVSTGATRDLILFHELIHAEHQARGTQNMTKRPDDFDTQEEFNTIEGDENDYRHQRGISQERHTHHEI
jgi:uncharacterized Zn-binding protein involved in type VI secretion